jgi:hypothetical protein
MNMTVLLRVIGVTAMSYLAITGSLEGQQRDPRLVGRLSPAAIDSVTALTQRASAHALPIEPLIQKALEGQSKGATEGVILRAVEDLLDRLELASAALGRESSEAALVAAAGAIHLGVSTETLRSVVTAYRSESLAIPLVVLTDMIRKGVAPETASKVIVQLAEAKIDLEGLQRFRRLVERDIDQGATPGEAALIRARGALLERRRGGGDASPST